MDALFSALKEFDFDKMLPELGAYVSGLKFWSWVLMMVGPVLLLVLGVLYLKCPPKDSSCKWAFSNKKTRENPDLWDKAHKLGGKIWLALGAVLCVVGIVLGLLFLAFDALTAATFAVWVIGIELVLIIASRILIASKI
ncbi:MAG: SdpI family protein [Oscillospiraceae bacterium]|nr:SdpI family protein [Oscillospiraceae bacterium]